MCLRVKNENIVPPSSGISPLITENAVILETRGLCKRFGDHTAFRDVNLQVSRGEVVCVIGPSGSGKSTLLRCINWLEVPTDGRIIFDGAVVGYVPRKRRLVPMRERELCRVRVQMGMVFQHFNLFPHLTALGNVMAGPLWVKGIEKKVAIPQARSMLERVGLGHRGSAYPGTLSGGEKQRVAIARALAMEPKLMLFDEPTSALDRERVSEVLNVIRELAIAGMTMIVVTHELGFAREVADRIVFMADGVVVEEGECVTVLDSSNNQRTRDFLGGVS